MRSRPVAECLDVEDGQRHARSLYAAEVRIKLRSALAVCSSLCIATVTLALGYGSFGVTAPICDQRSAYVYLLVCEMARSVTPHISFIVSPLCGWISSRLLAIAVRLSLSVDRNRAAIVRNLTNALNGYAICRDRSSAGLPFRTRRT